MIAAALVALGALSSASDAAAQAQIGVPNYTVNIDARDAAGRVLVNGIPIRWFGTGGDAPPGGLIQPAGIWLVEGENTIAVEVRAAKGTATARVLMLRNPGEPPLADEILLGAGSVERKVTAPKMPAWSWLDADTVADARGPLLGAVRAFHAAYEKRDLPAIRALRRALDKDLEQVMGPMTQDRLDREEAFVRAATVAPLPADLVVTAFADNRLFLVARADGTAPVTLSAPDLPIKPELGRFWVRKGGAWQVVR